MKQNEKLIKINIDVATVKENQVKELCIDNQNQSQKTWQLLGFFGATSAIIFSQEGISTLPGTYLGIIFTIITIFLIICILSFQGRAVSSMISVDFWDGTDELDYLKQKISALNRSKKSLSDLIFYRNRLNNLASIIFSILIFIYTFIFLIYNPMTKQQESIFKGSDVQNDQSVSIKPSAESSSHLPKVTNGQIISNEEVIKASDELKNINDRTKVK